MKIILFLLLIITQNSYSQIKAIDWYSGTYISRVVTANGKKKPVVLMTINRDFTGTSFFDANLSYSEPVIGWTIPKGNFKWSTDPGWEGLDAFNRSITCVWPNGEKRQFGYLEKKVVDDPFKSTMLWTPGTSKEDGKEYMREIGYKINDEYMRKLQPK